MTPPGKPEKFGLIAPAKLGELTAATVQLIALSKGGWGKKRR